MSDTEIEQRVAELEREVAELRSHHDEFEQAVDGVGQLLKSHAEFLVVAASGVDDLVRTRGLQIVDEAGRVVIQLAVGSEGQPLCHMVHYDASGEIKSVDENVFTP